MTRAQRQKTKPARQFAEEVRAYCASRQDEARAKRYARFFTEGYDPWGIDKDDPLWTAKKQEWLERFSGLQFDGFVEAGEILVSGGKYEEAMLAITSLASFREGAGAAMVPALARLFRAGISNWAETDVLAGQITDPMLASGAIRLEEFAEWRASDLKFQRRSVPVSMLGLLKAEAPIAPLLDFLRPLMLDKEKVVQQGVGWFLREAWKKDSPLVEKFLLEWKDTAPRLIFQYATEKMTPAHVSVRRSVKPEPLPFGYRIDLRWLPSPRWAPVCMENDSATIFNGGSV